MAAEAPGPVSGLFTTHRPGSAERLSLVCEAPPSAAVVLQGVIHAALLPAIATGRGDVEGIQTEVEGPMVVVGRLLAPHSGARRVTSEVADAEILSTLRGLPTTLKRRLAPALLVLNLQPPPQDSYSYRASSAALVRVDRLSQGSLRRD